MEYQTLRIWLRVFFAEMQTTMKTVTTLITSQYVFTNCDLQDLQLQDVISLIILGREIFFQSFLIIAQGLFDSRERNVCCHLSKGMEGESSRDRGVISQCKTGNHPEELPRWNAVSSASSNSTDRSRQFRGKERRAKSRSWRAILARACKRIGSLRALLIQ